jgi:ribonucleoside-diphosphate reductase alpha chain
VSLLPYSEHTYKQAPYQEIDKETYDAWVQKSPAHIQWERLSEFELEDNTTGSQELACAAGFCEII